MNSEKLRGSKGLQKDEVQEYILNIPIGEEVNLEVLLRIILQLTDIQSYGTKQVLINEVEKIIQSYCENAF